VDFLSYFLLLFLILHIAPILTPTWRWLVGVTLTIGGLLYTLWIAFSAPDFGGGPGDVFGIAILLFVAIGFASGVTVRALTLFLESRGVESRYRDAISIAGLPTTLAIIVLIVA
jgi:hypothetical protein